MTTGLVLTALALGIRHGFDWDHFVAIADLSASTTERRRGLLLSMAYALGHAMVVLVLGIAAIEAGLVVPRAVDQWMPRFVGVSLVALGGWALVEMVRRGGEVRLRSRTMILVGAASSGLRSLRSSLGANASPPTPAPAGAIAHRVGGPMDLATAPRPGVAAGVGVIHGVGVESPTQIAIFVASTAVVGHGPALALLFAWVAGLIVANTLLALAMVCGSGGGRWTGAVRSTGAVAVSLMSVVLGLMLVLGRELPL